MESIKNVRFIEIRIGTTPEFRHMLSQADIELLALVSGDVNSFCYLAMAGARS
jgi:hypothetical protein